MKVILKIIDTTRYRSRDEATRVIEWYVCSGDVGARCSIIIIIIIISNTTKSIITIIVIIVIIRIGSSSSSVNGNSIIINGDNSNTEYYTSGIGLFVLHVMEQYL